MPEKLDAVFFCEEPPEIEYRSGNFHVVQTIGQYRFERVIPPHTFLKALRRANAAVRAWQGGAEVISFPTPDSEEAAVG
jgi:hypothetical protein